MRNLGLLGCVGALVLALIVGGAWFVGIRNNLVGLDEQVNQQWAQVESQYQRRFDLIPNLVRTVQGAANFEKSTLEAVVNARSRVGQVAAPAGPPGAAGDITTNANQMEQFAAAQQGLSSALSRLLVVVERYPELKSNQNFLELQSQLEGTENRIAVERQRYNTAAQQYNTAIRRFPASMVASMSGFKAKAYFRGAPGSQQAPDVNFDFSNTATATR
ncbi:MAG TPA: LemA family protein [Thermoanaerobaculia bacterium]|jgi:LemA protein|nr:LemA family protein [Thermoanaerobaculia bacterium]